jgi:hypothetical protein
VAIRAYVARGGSVIAAHETSLRDEAGNRRAEFGLADVFGAHYVAGPRGIVKNTYVAFAEEHPLTSGFGGARRIMGGTRLITVAPHEGASAPLLYVPDFPDLPMEEVYVRDTPKDAAIIARETKQGGRVVYIPWNIGEIFWGVFAVDHARLIANAVRWALGTTPRVSVEGPGVIDVALRGDAQGLAVSLFNLTNPMMLKGPVRDVVPIGAQTVSIALPHGKSSGSARLLVADRVVPAAVGNGRLIVTVPSVERMEVLHVTWA